MSEDLSKTNAKTEIKQEEAVQRKQKQGKKALSVQKKPNAERKTKEDKVKSESRRHVREQLEGASKKTVGVKKQTADRAERAVRALSDWTDPQGIFFPAGSCTLHPNRTAINLHALSTVLITYCAHCCVSAR